MNHFAKVCRKQMNTKPQKSKKRRVNTVDQQPHPEDSVNFLRATKLYKSDYSSGEDNTVALIENDIAKIEPLNILIKIGNILTTLLVDSGSSCSILNRSLAIQVVKSSPHAVWIHEKVSPQLRTFSNEPIHIKGKIQTPITSNGCTSNSATFTVVADGLKSLVGRDLFDHLGLAVTQSSSVQDEDTVMPEEIFPNEKRMNGYRSDIEVEAGMTRASQEAHNRERESADGESRFFRTSVCRPLPLKERVVELKLARKIHGKRRSKKNLEGL